MFELIENKVSDVSLKDATSNIVACLGEVIDRLESVLVDSSECALKIKACTSEADIKDLASMVKDITLVEGLECVDFLRKLMDWARAVEANN